jgi:hypothetical protein
MRIMQTIRTTIALPADLHHKFKKKAFQHKKSFNQVVIDALYEKPQKEYSVQSEDQRIAETLAFFQKVGKMGRKIDLAEAIREDRDRNDR